ncbi:hypothetical protein AK830_g8080 [Neonectria ditissima]|uniref:Major facilitator superfamily (MFS) profile domain-containing protein n=1 Tax=Neonectria ditissima TaxID=78410 RepID=A0A0P7BDG0_9HYPO|nr:hypothetical protein AK830_g8080 [Neonectria ditissima]
MPCEPTSPEYQQSHAYDASETTPLLESEGSDAVRRTKSGKPFPTWQILLLCYARLMEPIAMFSVFPYIAQMVQHNENLPDSDVGFYSGLIESLFSIVEMAVLPIWCDLADRMGRKPALVLSLIGMAAGPVFFGLSRSIFQMILFRCLAGLVSGSGLIIRTMIGDQVTSDTQAKAYSWFAIADNLGAFLGPIIGGALADPVRQYPRFFAGIKFFEDYPYALPGIVVGAIDATGVITSALFLEETLDKREPESAEDETTEDPKQAISYWQLAKAPGVCIALWLYGHVNLLMDSFTAVLPVALYTPVSIGGMGWSPSKISLYMAVQAGSQSLWLLLVFPWLQRRMGAKGVLRICSIGYPIFCAGFIAMNALLREKSEESLVWFWIVTFFVTSFGPAVFMSFTAAQLVVNDAAPNPHLLGKLNTMAMVFHSGIRSVSPGVATAIYAVGVRGQVAWGYLFWAVLIPLSASLGIALRWLSNDRKG